MLKLLKRWQLLTELPKTKQGPTILLSLEGEAQEAALRVKTEDLVKEDGVQKITDELDKIYKKDATLNKYDALDKFDCYCRPAHVNINQYLLEFQRRFDKTKELGTTWGDDILAYRLLKNANLSEQNEKLAKATVDELTYDKVKAKLKSIFGDSSDPPACNSSNIKTEEIDFAGSKEWQENLSHQFSDTCTLYNETNKESQPEDEYTFFASRNFHRPNHQFSRNNQNSPRTSYNNQPQFQPQQQNRYPRSMFRQQTLRNNSFSRGVDYPRFQRTSTSANRGSHVYVYTEIMKKSA